MVAMRFDYRDIFRSARIAFSFQRLWLQFAGLFIGFAGYAIFTYLGLLTAGINIGVVWARYGLLPGIAGQYLPWYSWILYGLGVAALVFFWLVSATAVARAAYMHLKGNTFYTWREAFRFGLRAKGGSIIATPVTILAIAVFTGLGGGFIGLLGRVPYLGELGISLLTPVWFLAALFLVFVLLALGVSLLLTPAVLATTDDDAFEGIFQSFSTLYGQPWRLVVYQVLLCIVALAGLGVFSFFAKQTWYLMNLILAWGMGEKFANLSYSASYLLQNWIHPAVLWSKALLGPYASVFFFSRDFMAMDLRLTMTIAQIIMAVFLLVIGGFVISYPLAIFNSGNGIIFMILKKRKDGENLLERKDREEESDEDLEEEMESSEEEKPE